MSLLNLKKTKVEKSKVFRYRLNLRTEFFGEQLGEISKGEGWPTEMGNLFQTGTTRLLKKCFLMFNLQLLTKSLWLCAYGRSITEVIFEVQINKAMDYAIYHN